MQLTAAVVSRRG